MAAMSAEALEVGEARRAGLEPPLIHRTRLSAVDEAVYLLDSVSEPWSVHVEAGVRGTLDEPRLRAAVTAALARHPLARARTAISGVREGFEWEILPEAKVETLQVVEAPDDDTLNAVRADLQSLPVPLGKTPPLRVWLVRHPGGDVVMLNVSHAAADGIGSLRILRSIARAYAGQADPVPDVDPLTARDPGAFLSGGGSGGPVRRRMMPLRELLEAARQWTRVAPEGGEDLPGYGFHRAALTAEQTAVLTRGYPDGVTVNDLLLAALHLTVDGWNAQHGMTAGRIGVMMPVNLRPRAWWHEVVGNFSLMVPVVSGPGDRDNPATTLAAVSRRTREVKEDGTAALLLAFLARVQRLPLRLRRALASFLDRDPFAPTAVLSNLGRVDEPLSFGPEAGEVADLWFSPPVKMLPGLAVGAVTAGGRLRLVFRYRHPLFGEEAAVRFAGRYAAALLTLANGWPSPDAHGDMANT